jgi:hypothetical protein
MRIFALQLEQFYLQVHSFTQASDFLQWTILNIYTWCFSQIKIIILIAMKTKTEKLIYIMTIHLYILISNEFNVLLITNVNVQIKIFLFNKRYISMLRFFQRNYMFNIYTEII